VAAAVYDLHTARGLGNATDAGGAYDISPNGFIVGSAPTGVPNSVTVGAYWTILSL